MNRLGLERVRYETNVGMTTRWLGQLAQVTASEQTINRVRHRERSALSPGQGDTSGCHARSRDSREIVAARDAVIRRRRSRGRACR